jgi:hypothetical protein
MPADVCSGSIAPAPIPLYVRLAPKAEVSIRLCAPVARLLKSVGLEEKTASLIAPAGLTEWDSSVGPVGPLPPARILEPAMSAPAPELTRAK